MILRKPYAFIIKHFRLLHLLLLGLLIYIFLDLNAINQLFASFQKTSTFIYAGGSAYIDELAYYAITAGLFFSGVAFWLLKEKKKPTALYLGMTIYFIVLYIGFGFLFNQLVLIQDKIFESDMIILVKDISFLLMVPLYIFIPLCFIRGIGFNIKQFNFSKDIQELQIVDKDSQEFELLIGQNNYKYFRTIRRALRETKYFVLENLFVISIIASILGVVLIGVGIHYYNEYLKRINEAEVISIDSISYIVNKSYITAKDFNGNKIKDGYKYVVVDMAFHNMSQEAKKLNLDLITLTDDRIIYYPTLNRNGKFYDLGVPYKEGQLIMANEIVEATLTFEIPASVRTRNFTLKVQYGLDASTKNVIAKYRNFAVNTMKIDIDEIVTKKKINEVISVDVVGQNKLNLTIKGYSLLDSYNSRYVSCNSLDHCEKLSSVIKPKNTVTDTMLMVDYNALIDENANFLRTFNTHNKMFRNYATIRYILYNKEYIEKAFIVTNSDVDNKVFFEVPRAINNAEYIELQLDFRDYLYIVPLKEKTE